MSKKDTKGKKSVAVIVLIIALLGLAVAFAALSTTLTINGTAVVDPDEWGIVFEDLQVAKEGTAIDAGTAEIGADQISITGVNATLKAPGDTVKYTFDVHNTGTIPAKLSDITKPEPTFTGSGESKTQDETLVKQELVYTLTYTDGGATVAAEDTLDAGATKNVTLTIGYDIDATELPVEQVNITAMNIGLNYVQDIQ